MPSRSLPRHRAERAAAIGQDAPGGGDAANANADAAPDAFANADAGVNTHASDAAASWATNVTRAALVKEYFESRAIETTIGVAALPVGIALALAGRKHHQKLTLALVAGFGVWLGLMAIDLLRDLVPNVLGDSVTIPDNDYVNYGSAAVVALILVSVAANVYKLFGIVVGLMCAFGIYTYSFESHIN